MQQTSADPTCSDSSRRMTLKTRKKRSKLRDLFIIIRLAIRCIAIVLINGLTCVAGKLCGLIKYKSENIWAQPKKRQFVADVKSTERPRNQISETFHRHCLRKADQAKKEQKSLQKKRNRTSLGSANCSRLQPPPVEELIFTQDDVWRLKNITKRSTQTQVRMYSGDNVKCNPEAVPNSNNNKNWLNNFPTSTSRDVKQSAAQEKGRKALVIKSEFVKRYNLEWSQRGKQHYHPSHATSANILQFCDWGLKLVISSTVIFSWFHTLHFMCIYWLIKLKTFASGSVLFCISNRAAITSMSLKLWATPILGEILVPVRAVPLKIFHKHLHHFLTRDVGLKVSSSHEVRARAGGRGGGGGGPAGILTYPWIERCPRPLKPWPCLRQKSTPIFKTCR